MFSFFRRGKSKDDGEKKEKVKEKSSFSPFARRQDSNKKEPSLGSLNQHSTPVYSLTSEPSDTNTLSDSKIQDADFPPNLDTHLTTLHSDTDYSNAMEGLPVQVETLTPTNCVSKEYSLNSCDFPTNLEPALVVNEECLSVGERGGSSERDAVFKTAPNTPVLPKHLTVASELSIDPETYAHDVITESSDFVKAYLGENLDLPSADGKESSDADFRVLEHNDKDLVESEILEDDKGKCSVKEESSMCEEMSHAPGHLYDIAEEETSEDEPEDQSEEEEDEEDDDDEDSGNVTQPTIEEEYPEEIFKRNLVNHQEAQFQERVGDLKTRLCARELEYNKLLCQIEELQRDVMVKSGGMDRLQAELNAAHKESECVLKKVKKLESNLEILKQKNCELTEELQRRSEGFDFNHLLELEEQVKELTARMTQLESQLEQIKQERDKLKLEVEELQSERDEEKRIIQEALEEALEEKHAIQSRFERDFEKLRTVNTDREQQLLDDFEWKLREVEQACKRRLEEKEKSAKLRIKELEDKLSAVEQDLDQLDSLKQYEAEACQLRGLNLEQQRALRMAERTKEELQVSEKILKEEVKKMKELLEKEKSALTTMQAIHNREIDEKDRKTRFRLEQQKTELNSQWEERLRKETIRLRVELDQINRDEKRVTLEVARAEKEAELTLTKEKWEKKFQDLFKEVDAMKLKLAEKEEEHKKNVESVRTNADRDIFELRRKLDRIDLTYQEQIEKIQKQQEREKEKLVEESECKLQSCEQSYQLQLSSTRATLELVKEQLKREAADQVQSLHNNHRRQLEEQWEQLMQERDETIAAMEARHRASMEKMKTELEATHKCRNSKEQELVDLVNQMRQEISGKTGLLKDLSSQAELLKSDVEHLNSQVASQDEQFHQTKAESEAKLRLLEEDHKQHCQELVTNYQQESEQWRSTVEQLQAKVAELTKQLEEKKDTKTLEDIKKSLSEKEHQVAQLSKEKHLYQLELMNRNCLGGNVTARQRRKHGRGKANKPGPSRK